MTGILARAAALVLAQADQTDARAVGGVGDLTVPDPRALTGLPMY